MKFRKKPVIIEAFRVGDLIPHWFIIEVFEKHTALLNEDGTITIKTLKGDMVARDGDYVIKGVNGEIYSCKEEIFCKTYEQVKG